MTTSWSRWRPEDKSQETSCDSSVVWPLQGELKQHLVSMLLFGKRSCTFFGYSSSTLLHWLAVAVSALVYSVCVYIQCDYLPLSEALIVQQNWFNQNAFKQTNFYQWNINRMNLCTNCGKKYAYFWNHHFFGLFTLASDYYQLSL